MSTFSVVTQTSGNYYAPDFTVHTERWWSDPTPFDLAPSVEVANSFLTQVDEYGQDGKQSCFLTAQLNALIARDRINQPTAQSIQDHLNTDTKYNGYWVPYSDKGQVGWTPNPQHFAYVLREAFGVQVSTEHIDSTSAADLAGDRLRSGYAVVLLGRSAAGGHARLAFETNENPGHFFMHDSKYPETTGHHPYSRLTEFHTQNRVVVY